MLTRLRRHDSQTHMHRLPRYAANTPDAASGAVKALSGPSPHLRDPWAASSMRMMGRAPLHGLEDGT